LISNAVEKEWDFTENVLTDCSPQELALKILKSKMLEFLPHDVPYLLKPVLEFWEEDSSGKDHSCIHSYDIVILDECIIFSGRKSMK